MNARITVLVENTAGGRGLLGEHGLSFWIEWGHKRILFDTGAGHVLSPNASRLGVTLESADAIALSHGHYDHTGGLAGLLRSGWRPRVYAHPAAFSPKFSRGRNGAVREIGMPILNEPAVRERAELIHCTGPTEIGDGLHLSGPVPRRTDFEDTGGSFFLDSACRRADDLIDDQAAFVAVPAGTIVILGCAHAGVINTLNYIRELTGGRPIHTVLGGMHLPNADAEQMDRTVAELRRLDVQRLMPAHCTGLPATARLWNEFPSRCAPCPVGTVVSLDG